MKRNCEKTSKVTNRGNMLLRYAFATFGRFRGRDTDTDIKLITPTVDDHGLGESSGHLLKEHPCI